MLADVGIVVMGVASDLSAQKRWTLKGLIDVRELYLGKDEAFIVAMKLVYLNGVWAIGHKVTRLLYTPRTA
jgi:hypothetical protein